MKEKNEIKLNNDNNNNNEKAQFKVASLPSNFYRRIIELENKIQLSQPNFDEIKQLSSLYKKAIEYFCTSSPNKVQFFSNKLNKLLVGVDKLSKKKKSKWSLYMDAHKKNLNKFKLFLEIEGSNQEAEEILQAQNEKFGNAFKEYYKNIDMQKNILKEKINSKRINKRNQIKNEINDINDININSNEIKDITKINEEKENINCNNNININNINNNNYNSLIINKFKGRNDLVNSSLRNFLKKFHYIYLNSKIFKEPIESFNYILDDIFCHKVTKYFYYQEQIKEFQMILDDKNQGNDEDSLAFFLTDLENERKKYYQNLENFVEKIMKKIQNKCAETKINNNKNLEMYKDEFMDEISKIFS